MIPAAAALVCALAAYIAFGFLGRARKAQRALPRVALLSAAAGALGCGFSAAHLLALKVFLTKIPENVELTLAIDSVAIAIVVTWLGFGLALWRPASAVNGGAVVAGAAGGMHYVGMTAMPLAGAMAWDMFYLAVSILVGLLLGAAALRTVMRSPAQLRHRSRGAILMALAIVAVHFSAVAGASRPSSPLPRGTIDYAAIPAERATSSAPV